MRVAVAHPIFNVIKMWFTNFGELRNFLWLLSGFGYRNDWWPEPKYGNKFSEYCLIIEIDIIWLFGSFWKLASNREKERTIGSNATNFVENCVAIQIGGFDLCGTNDAKPKLLHRLHDNQNVMLLANQTILHMHTNGNAEMDQIKS